MIHPHLPVVSETSFFFRYWQYFLSMPSFLVTCVRSLRNNLLPSIVLLLCVLPFLPNGPTPIRTISADFSDGPTMNGLLADSVVWCQCLWPPLDPSLCWKWGFPSRRRTALLVVLFEWQCRCLLATHCLGRSQLPRHQGRRDARIFALVLESGPGSLVINSVFLEIFRRSRALLVSIWGRTERSRKLCSKGHCR